MSSSLPKPLWGDPCNGCGLCCIGGPCGAARVVTGQTEGRCRQLLPNGLGGYSCGLTTRPGPPEFREAMVIAIGAGVGCDMVETVKDAQLRLLRKRTLVAEARAARAKASPGAERILRTLGLAPP